jgi:hypothetical protein
MADATAPAPVTAPVVAPPAPALGTPEYDAAMAAKFDASQPKPAAEPAKKPADPPAPILGKFKTQDDLVKAYQELEKKLGAPAPAAPAPTTPPAPESKLAIPPATEQTPEQKAAAEATAKAGVDFNALSKEFADNGKLSDETFKKLADGGIPREMAEQYIAGQQALATQAAAAYDAAAFAQAGGEAKFNEMTAWAAASLPMADKVTFNEAVTSGDTTKMQLAVANLKTKFEANFGAAPAATLGGQPSKATQAYESMAQVKADMSKPEYKKDPAFRASVEARLAVSDNLYTTQQRQ